MTEESAPRPRGAPRSLSARLASLAIGVGLAVVFFTGLGGRPLFEPDEGRYAEIPREMLATHDWVTPRLDGVLYFEKPPLYYWLNAGAMSLFGFGEWVVRSWSALFGLAGAGLAWTLGRSLGGRRTAVLAALILGASPLYLVLSHVNFIDITASFFLSATLVCFWLAQDSSPGRRQRLLWYGMFAAAALAVLTKGLIGVVIPGAVVFLYLLLARQWQLLRRVPWVTGVPLFLVLAVPWHVAVGRRNPSFWWFYFVHEHLLRYASQTAQRLQPWWFFIPVILVGFLPWSGMLVGLLPRATRRAGPNSAKRRGILFLALWASFIVAFFSASESKLVPYVLPVFVPLAVLAALGWEAAVDTPGPGRTLVRRILPWSAGLLALLAGAGLWIALGEVPAIVAPGALSPSVPLFAAATVAAAVVAVHATLRWRPRRAFVASLLAALCLSGTVTVAAPAAGEQLSSKEIAEYLRTRLGPEDGLACFGTYSQALPFYLRRTVDVVGYHGELEFGISHLSPDQRQLHFPSATEFRPRWLSGERIYLVMDHRSRGRLAEAGLRPGPVLLETHGWVLMSNDFGALER